VILHGGLVAAFLFMRPGAAPPPAPMIMIHMLAAPAGDRAVGAVVDQPVATPAPTPPKPTATKAAPATPTAKPKPAPKAATPTQPPKAADKPATAPQKAGGGETGGRGADVANIDTPGIEFDYPYYTNNIVRALVTRFGNLNGSLEAEVRFVIRRDGTVDPASIKLVTPSGNYSFDQRALGTVESAANAKAFGPLPPGFREDILPVTFRFSPKIIR
jgi:outer membrane biosynthesis protein TonB